MRNSDTNSSYSDLRSETLTAFCLFMGILGYSWTWLNLWTVTGRHASLTSWLGGGVLLLGTMVSYRLRKRQVQVSTSTLIISMFCALACAAWSFRLPSLIYLFALPIILASALFSRPIFLMVAAATGFFILSYPGGQKQIVVSNEFMVVGTLTLITIAAWLSSRNLQTTLAWFSAAYESAYRNEQMARERQAELRRALKALDEATQNLARANYRLTQERNRAESARRLKQQLAQTISHELRTPLNLIIGFADVMAQSPEYYGAPLPAAYMRDLSIIHRNAYHLQKLINDVLDLARIEAAQMTLTPELTNPRELVLDAIDTARSLVESHGLMLQVELEPQLPVLRIDPTRIRQVLFNLLNNAARFTETGGVTVRVYREKDEIVFAVKDTGIGIDPEDLSMIFEEFRQVDGSTRRRQGGAGLGLAISQRFVKLHHGRMWVESQLGQGSTFYFSLPVEPTESGLNPINFRELELNESVPLPDDHPLLLGVTPSLNAASFLARLALPCRTIVLNSLEQAQIAAQRLLPRWVVIDSAHNAIEAGQLQALAQAPGHPNTAWIACPLPGEALLPEVNFDGYLSKPVLAENLWDVIRPFGEKIENVLVIDDDRDFTRLLCRMLENQIYRYQVICVHSGYEGLAMLDQHLPDLILLDLQLPDIAGVQVLERIRAVERWRQIPVIIISGQDRAENGEIAPQPMLIAHSQSLSSTDVLQWLHHLLKAMA